MSFTFEGCLCIFTQQGWPIWSFFSNLKLLLRVRALHKFFLIALPKSEQCNLDVYSWSHVITIEWRRIATRLYRINCLLENIMVATFIVVGNIHLSFEVKDGRTRCIFHPVRVHKDDPRTSLSMPSFVDSLIHHRRHGVFAGNYFLRKTLLDPGRKQRWNHNRRPTRRESEFRSSKGAYDRKIGTKGVLCSSWRFSYFLRNVEHHPVSLFWRKNCRNLLRDRVRRVQTHS